MSEQTRELFEIVDGLPAHEKQLICGYIRQAVFEWDPDFTKLTPAEAEILRQSDLELERGEVVSIDDINWD